MTTIRRFKVADLFCGAGGSSTGLLQACAAANVPLDLVAVNHWERAIETHAFNHPKANHFCQDLADLDPKKAVPGGKLDLLVASPECTHHSVARGGKPVNDQSRASAYCVHRWAAALDVRRILIENVPEFVTWGPLCTKGRPTKTGKGKLFIAFIDTLKAMGYRVEWRILNAANHGGATTRRRLFIQAAKGRTPIVWPQDSHEANPTAGLFGKTLPRWRAAREIIDWTLPGQSIFTRKRPLSENTLKRIEAGLRKFGGANAEPFLVLLRGTSRSQVDAAYRSVSSPTPTITASGTHVGLCEPFVCSAGGPKVDARRVSDPMNTVLTRDHMALVEPFLMHTTHHGSDRVYDVDEPLPCVTGANRGEQALVEPFLVTCNHAGGTSRRAHSTNEPVPTLQCSNQFGVIIPTNYGERPGQSPRCHDVDRPLPTIATGNTHGLVQPFIVPHRQFDGMQVDDINAPIRTVTATNGGCHAVCEPFLVPFYANGQADATTDPLRTVTTKDRHALVEPHQLDIRFRMLQPHELAAAMGFPAGYKITGNRSEQVKQIGNAVEVNTAAALTRAILESA